MTPVTSPVGPNNPKAAVADLQDALRIVLDRKAVLATDDGNRQALSERLKVERTDQKYGEATRKVVAVFQSERNIPPQDGMVNDATALNALLRSWGMLARVGSAGVKLALKNARDAVVVALTDAEATAAEQQYAAFSRNVWLADPLPGGRATYADLLAKTGLDGPTRNKFADVFLAHRGTGDELWKAAEAAKIPVPAIRKLQLQGKMSFLTGHSGPITARLVDRVKQNPAELVAADFHTADAWKAEVFDLAGVPASGGTA